MSNLEETFKLHLRLEKLDNHFVREYRFHKARRWRFDFADIENMIAIEVEGGTWSKPRKFLGQWWIKATGHVTGKGFQDDCIKYNAAAKMGWQVYRFDSPMVAKGEAINFIKELYEDINNDK